MYYCFVKQDFQTITDRDPLALQAKYAKESGSLLYIDIEQKEVMNSYGSPVDLTACPVLLRCSCDYGERALQLLESNGFCLIETLNDLKLIENWSNLSITHRPIFRFTIKDYLNKKFDNTFLDFLRHNDNLFIKTSKKGVSIRTSTQAFLQDQRVEKKLKQYTENNNSIILVSKLEEIKKDFIGNRESRHFIFQNKVVNSSRCIHSLVHNPLRSHRRKAEEIAKRLSNSCFPANYVLDLGEFIDNDSTEIDIIEINPVTTSMCYINNSIFTFPLNEAVQKIHEKTHFGFEYCLDSILHNERYFETWMPGDCFEYKNDCQFEIL